MNISEFTDAYIECALWSSTDDDGEPLDGKYGIDDIAPETLAKMKASCAAFQRQFEVALRSIVASSAGHDFWLTRNGHGAGFWERGDAIGDMLSDGAKAYGSSDLYIGDDGLIYTA